MCSVISIDVTKTICNYETKESVRVKVATRLLQWLPTVCLSSNWANRLKTFIMCILKLFSFFLQFEYFCIQDAPNITASYSMDETIFASMVRLVSGIQVDESCWGEEKKTVDSFLENDDITMKE